MPGTPADDPDEQQLQVYALALVEAVHAALPGWVERSVVAVATEAGVTVGDDLRRRSAEAGARAQEVVGGRVRQLLLVDIDEQGTGPLAVLRGAVSYPTDVLVEVGVRPVERDAVDERLFPDDLYGLTPASFADIDPSLHEPGLAWGAAKAFVHLKRRRAEGRR